MSKSSQFFWNSISLILGLLLSFFSLHSLASTPIGNDLNVISIKGSASIYRQEKDTEEYEGTCSREVDDGTVTQCKPLYETHCTKVPYECHQVETGEDCEEVPATRTETYSCTLSRTVYRDVFDHYAYVSAEVSKKFVDKNIDLSNCNLNLHITDNDESLTSDCLTAIVKSEKVDRKVTFSEGNEFRNVKMNLSFFDIYNLNATLGGLDDLHYENGIVSFTATDLSKSTNFVLKANLKRDRLIFKDSSLLDTEIDVNQLMIEPKEEGLFKLSFDLKKLVKFDSTKRHKFSLTLKTKNEVDLSGNVINEKPLSNKLEKTIKINE